MFRLKLCTAAAIVTLAQPSIGLAQDFTNQPIHFVVPHSAGTGVDAVARALATPLAASLGTSVVVQNREGANGAIGSAQVARARPDGHTLMLNASPPFVTFPFTQKAPSYDAVKDFTPIALVGGTPMVLVVSNESDIRSFEDLVKHARRDPAKASFASPGLGSAGHLAMEQLMRSEGFVMEHVLYRSTPNSLTDVAAGHVLAALASAPAAESLVQAGKLRMLAVGSASRLPQHPDVPTLAQVTGKSGFEARVWYGVLGPAGLDARVVARLGAAIKTVMEQSATDEALRKLSVVPQLSDSAAFAALLERDAGEARKLLGEGQKAP
ncbi:MAG: tripartite tricarboxylate transporter substrate binding protein [Burkholderiaceae bacterium]|nr:tripartite tricarboxylate transporter substrate binding protein [Burkholderiaceae bacterium]